MYGTENGTISKQANVPRASPITEPRAKWLVAGGSISGDIFKCQLQSVEAAIENGVYGKASMTPYMNRLKRIFPSGVCDFTKPGAGRPEDLFASNKKALQVSQESPDS